MPCVISVISFEVLNQSAVGTWYIDVFQDGNFYQSIEGNTTGVFGNISFQNVSGLDTTLTFKMKATVAMNVDMLINYQITGVNGLSNYAQISTVQTVLAGNVSINSTLPDMKISDFFSGVLKEFNATCVATSENTFEILPLEDWYSQGAIVDITEHTDIDSIDIDSLDHNGIIKSREYLLWRYGPERGEYQVYKVQSKKLSCVAVTRRIQINGIFFSLVLDFFSEDKALPGHYLRKICKEQKTFGLLIAPQVFSRLELAKNGFLKVPGFLVSRKVVLAGKFVRDRTDKLSKFDPWNLSLGDFDAL